ncbi:helix-turn-helix domain-containing protein, partial [Kribbella catacumbae]|uniref:helix-turn-helix domain-containing protein n=1 Tax=Kribbella catacumbae TaxID=460086 RepID=UPI0003692903
MTIFRAPRPKNGWTELDNRLLRNKELSFKARGILSYILSHTENWATDAASIAKASEKDGRDSVQSGLKELELKWYLHRRKWQNPANGQWRTDSYVF